MRIKDRLPSRSGSSTNPTKALKSANVRFSNPSFVQNIAKRRSAIAEFRASAQDEGCAKKLVEFLEYRNSFKGRFWSFLNKVSFGRIKIPN